MSTLRFLSFILGLAVIIFLVFLISRPSHMLSITSPSFIDSSAIPAQFTCDGQNTPPPLDFSQVPRSAQSLVLIVDDPDSPSGTWQHWLVWNLPPTTTHLAGSLPDGAIQGKNDFGQISYGGPCPHTGTHHYHFRLFALDTTLNLPSGANRPQIDQLMSGHVVATGELVGTYSRP